MPTRTRPWRSSTCSPASSARRPSRCSCAAWWRAARGSSPASPGRSPAAATTRANLLLEALATPGVSKSALLEVIAAQKSRFGVRELLTAAYTQEPNEKAALFRIIGEIADASRRAGAHRPRAGQGPDRARAHHQHPGALQHAGGADGAAGSAQGSQQADPRRDAVGAAAHGRPDRHRARLRRCCAIPRSTCSTSAIDVVIKANHPETIKYLIEVLKDENENARRAAVEVLNEVGNAQVGEVPARGRSRTATGGCAAAPPMRSARSAARR